VVYSASTQQVLPSSCWRYYEYPDNFDYITVVRVKQNGSADSILTFDNARLECLGKWNGQAASCVGWFSHSCNMKYLGTSDPIRTVSGPEAEKLAGKFKRPGRRLDFGVGYGEGLS
jgi:hypothetical protein